MSERELRAAIDRLVNEIDALDEDDAGSREQLLALAEKLGERLERHQASDTAVVTPDEDSDNALIDMVSRYEANHPKLTTILNDIMVRLASMGI